MKKLLFFVLIAFAICSEIEQFQKNELEDLDFNLQGIDIKEIWEKIKKYASKAKEFLQKIGLWDPLISILKTSGRALAITFCESKSIPEIICVSIVDFILKYIK